MNEADYTMMTCQGCGIEYPAARPWQSKYHSPACRLRAHRAKGRADPPETPAPPAADLPETPAPPAAPKKRQRGEPTTKTNKRADELRTKGGWFQANCWAERLLILSCSATKRANIKPLPALVRYDGPAFQIVRKWQAERIAAGDERAVEMTQIYILSARHHLLRADHPIVDYDQPINATAAQHIRSRCRVIMERWESIGGLGNLNSVMICIAANYEQAFPLKTLPATIRSTARIETATGKVGEKNAQLKAWLNAYTPTED